MNTKYLVETSVWIEYYFGSDTEIKRIIEKESIATNVITLAELSYVFEKENLDGESFIRFVKSKAVPCPLTMSSAVDAGRIKHRLRKERPKFGLADAMHLAIARERKAVLVTTDSDFAGLPDVLFLDKR